MLGKCFCGKHRKLPAARSPYACIFLQKAGIAMPQFTQTQQQKALVGSMAKALPEYRKKARLSQIELARAIGKSRQKISEIERGSAPLGWDTYLAILLVLSSRGALDGKGEDAARLAATSEVVGIPLIL